MPHDGHLVSISTSTPDLKSLPTNRAVGNFVEVKVKKAGLALKVSLRKCRSKGRQWLT